MTVPTATMSPNPTVLSASSNKETTTDNSQQPMTFVSRNDIVVAGIFPVALLIGIAVIPQSLTARQQHI